MTLLALLALAVLTAGVLLTRTVRGDGHGHRPPPRSHLGEESPGATWRMPAQCGGR